MHTEQRARFEKHILDNFVIALEYGHLSLEKDGDGSYVHGETNGWWMIWQKAETPLLARIAELEGQLAGANTLIIAQRASIDEMTKQLANREPFVVKMPLSISVLISDGLHADFMLNSEIKAAITAAGGTVL